MKGSTGMKVESNRIDDTKYELTVEVGAERVEKELNRVYQGLVGKVAVPGFRQGKVPRKVLEMRFGLDYFFDEVKKKLIPEAFTEALKQENLEPVRENIGDISIAKGEPLIFTVTVEVIPPVELPEYKGLKVQRDIEQVDADRVERELQNLRESQARLIPVEDRPAKSGDYVIIDYAGCKNGEQCDEATAENFFLELGSGMFPDEFENTLIGVSAGEKKEFPISFPDDYRSDVLAGETIDFTVDIKELKSKELPELDDEFAGEVSRFETIATLREDITKKLEAFAKARADMGVKEKMLDQLVEGSTMTVPEVLVERKIDRMIDSLGRTLQSESVTMNEYLEQTGSTMDSLREQYNESAQADVRRDLVLREIVKRETIKVAYSEVDQRIVEMAESTNQDVERLRSVFANSVSFSVLEEEIAREKAMDFLLDHADINDVEVKQEME